jgi:parallel beta-helix repeat protein
MKRTVFFASILVSLFVFWTSSGNAADCTKTVNAGGSIQSVVSGAVAGDVICVRGGTYHQTVSISNSGNASSPITLQNYPGEVVVIDGQGTLPSSSWGALIALNGSYINVSGFEVKNTNTNNAIGVILNGHHNKVSNMDVHHAHQNGVLIKGDYGIVENSRVWSNAMSNVNGSSSMWAGGLNAARDNVNGITDNAIIRGNTVYNNWGEGLSAFESAGTLIENNIVYNNWSVNLYVSDSQNITVRNNLVYNASPNQAAARPGSLTIADELANKQRSSNVQFTNNIVYGTNLCVACWTIAEGLSNINANHNTVVDGLLRIEPSYGTDIVESANCVITGSQVPGLGTVTPGSLSASQFADASCSAGTGADVSLFPGVIIDDTTAPSVPADLIASAVSSSAINLAWTASTDNVGISGYNIYRNGEQIAVSKNTSYSDVGLTPETAYAYTVSAYDSARNESALSAIASATTWSDIIISTKFAIGDRIQTTSTVNVRSSGSLSSSMNGTQSDGTLGTVIGGPIRADGISWWSVDFDSGVDGWTEEDGIEKAVINIAPSGIAYRWSANNTALLNTNKVAAAGLNDNNLIVDVNLSGKSSGDSAAKYEAGGIIWTAPKTISAVNFTQGTWLTSNDGGFGANLSLQFTTDGATWKESGWTVAPAYAYNSSSVSGLIYAFSGSGTSVLGVRISGQVHTATTPSSYFENMREVRAFSPAPVPDISKPSTPLNLTATAFSSSQINLSWSASSDNVGVVGYGIYRDGTAIATTPNTSYSNTGLVPDTAYSYAITAFDAAGNESVQSAIASATTPIYIPTEKILVIAQTADTSFQLGSGSSYRSLSQSFISPASSLTSIQVGLSKYRSPSYSITFSLKNGLTGTTLYSATIPPSQVISTSSSNPTWISIAIPSSIVLIPGNTYYINLATPTTNSQNYYRWSANKTNPYSSGYFYRATTRQSSYDGLAKVLYLQ